MLIDSNILFYAINTDSPKHIKAQKFLQDSKGSLIFAHQNIFEAIRVLTHPKFTFPMTVNKALEAVENILSGCKVVSPNDKTPYIAFELIKKYKLSSDLVFDSYLAATTLSNGVDTIVTDNVRDFKKFKEIKIVNPFEKD